MKTMVRISRWVHGIPLMTLAFPPGTAGSFRRHPGSSTTGKWRFRRTNRHGRRRPPQPSDDERDMEQRVEPEELSSANSRGQKAEQFPLICAVFPTIPDVSPWKLVSVPKQLRPK